MYITPEFSIVWFHHIENSVMDMTEVAIGSTLIYRSISTILILVCVSKATTTTSSTTKTKSAIDYCIPTKATATWLTLPIVTHIFMSKPATSAADLCL